MKMLTAVLALLAVGGVGVRALADATQNHPDGSARGSRSEVILEVETQDDYDPQLAANGLLGTCQQVVDAVTMKSFEARGDGEFAIVVQPSLGTNAEKRFVGCLEDLTIDRVKGHVVEVRDLEPAGADAD
jgi:hypothetical protein